MIPNNDILLNTLKDTMGKDEDVLFAYLYGSFLYGSSHYESDIHVAVYLKSSDLAPFIKKEVELTTALIMKLHTDRVNLRILNVSPSLLQYKIIKEGSPAFVRDERARVDFETTVSIDRCCY
jgi:predicted nucleotidyltransferase